MEALTGHSEGGMFLLRRAGWVAAALALGPSWTCSLPRFRHCRSRQTPRPALGRLSRPAAPPRAWRQKATSHTARGLQGNKVLAPCALKFSSQTRSGRHPGLVCGAGRPETHPDHSSVVALPPPATVSHLPVFTEFSLGDKSLHVPSTH